MSSRSSHRSHSRNHSKRHKKSHKRSRKSDDEIPSPTLDKLASKEEEEEEEEIIKTSPVDLKPSDVEITVKRKSRWSGNENEKVFFPYLRTTISTTNLTEDQQKIHLLQVQIEETTRRLKTNDFGISSNPGDRSPSPEPIYDQHGKRQNTREVRARRKIEEERHQLVTKLLALCPDYKPPADYKAQQIKYTDKVMLPQEDYPKINFIGLILGPRGTTLKTLEKETNSRITVRGKGSLRDGKMGLVKSFPLPGENEPLHVYITGTSVEIVAKAVEKIQEIINQIIDSPEGLDDFRKDQLRQVALIRGTLRENDGLIKVKVAEEAEKIFTNTILCTVCGGAGHISSDCKLRKKPDGFYTESNPIEPFNPYGNRQQEQKFEGEYQSLLNELKGKKDTNTNTLSLNDQRNLMSGSRSNGPILPIAGESSSSSTRPVKSAGAVSFNSNGSMNIDSNYLSSQSIPFITNSPNRQSNYSNTSFSSTGPRYNNNDICDGYHLLRRSNHNNNYSSYIEGDSYRAQHIPALIESQRNSNYQPQTYPNQQWNPYNTSMYYQNSYQQHYYQNNNLGYRPPLPKEPPPPLPPR